MGKNFVIAILFACVLLDAAPMAVHNPKCDWHDVKTDFYQCTFYNGCMFPVWFKSADGKMEFPRHFLLDWIKFADAPDTELHYLHEDRFATVAVLENTDDTLVVECKGKFCKGVKSFPGVTATYRWTLKRHSPEINLDAQIAYDDNAPRRLCLTMTGSMAFRNMPFDKVQIAQNAPKPFRTPGKAPEVFVSRNGLALLTADGLRFGVSTPAVAWNNSHNRFFTYISQEMPINERTWNGGKPFSFKMTFNISK